MAEAVNQVRGKTITLDHMTELSEPVIGEHSTVKDAVLEIGKNYALKNLMGSLKISLLGG